LFCCAGGGGRSRSGVLRDWPGASERPGDFIKLLFVADHHPRPRRQVQFVARLGLLAGRQLEQGPAGPCPFDRRFQSRGNERPRGPAGAELHRRAAAHVDPRGDLLSTGALRSRYAQDQARTCFLGDRRPGDRKRRGLQRACRPSGRARYLQRVHGCVARLEAQGSCRHRAVK